MFFTRGFVNKFRTAAGSSFAKRYMSFNTKDLLARENVPFYGAVVGLGALVFQVGILHPFHTELSDQFSDIQRMVYELELLSKEIDYKINRINVIQEEIKDKERRILQREEQILRNDRKVHKLVSKLIKSMEMEIAEEQKERMAENENFLHKAQLLIHEAGAADHHEDFPANAASSFPSSSVDASASASANE